MAKLKYYYDTETCKYEQIRTTFSDVAINVVLFLSFSTIMAISIFLLIDHYLESPRELVLKNEIEEITYYYKSLNNEIDKLTSVLTDITHRDENIYRAVLGAEPSQHLTRNLTHQSDKKYTNINDIDHKDMIVELSKKIDVLKHRLYAQSKSQDETVKLARNKEKLFSSIPAIQPIHNKKLYALASGYGFRIHPVYKVRKKHLGIDFSAPTGTPIYATADGKISRAVVTFSGYGKMIEINHGFGYRTRYAHMHGFNVKRGQHVKRGELIGYVGNTGLSTAPHLHYEVLVKGKHVNPVHFFFNDLSPSEYKKILQLASAENQSLGM